MVKGYEVMAMGARLWVQGYELRVVRSRLWENTLI
jgi:hypothetical protein